MIKGSYIARVQASTFKLRPTGSKLQLHDKVLTSISRWTTFPPNVIFVYVDKLTLLYSHHVTGVILAIKAFEETPLSNTNRRVVSAIILRTLVIQSIQMAIVVHSGNVCLLHTIFIA